MIQFFEQPLFRRVRAVRHHQRLRQLLHPLLVRPEIRQHLRRHRRPRAAPFVPAEPRASRARLRGGQQVRREEGGGGRERVLGVEGRDRGLVEDELRGGGDGGGEARGDGGGGDGDGGGAGADGLGGGGLDLEVIPGSVGRRDCA